MPSPMSIWMPAAVLVLGSCSMSRLDPYPEDWPALRPAPCPNLSGAYSYVGKFSPLAAEGLRPPPKFDSWIFSRRVDPNLGWGDYVVLSHNVKNNVIFAKFFTASGRMAGELSGHLPCGADGYVNKKAMETEAGTHGAAIMQRLLVTESGSLVVFSQVKTVRRGVGIFPISRNEESWVEFERK